MKREIEDPLNQSVTVQRLVPGGKAMGALADGRTFFARGAFSEDKIRIKKFRDKKTFVEVLSFDLIEKSPQRVEPSCPVARACGGCDWMSLGAEAQALAKVSLLEQALARTGKFELPLLDQSVRLHASPQAFQYRTRVRLQVKRGRIGFFSEGSHELVEVDTCQVASPRVMLMVHEMRRLVSEHAALFEIVQHLEVRAFDLGDASAALDPKTCAVQLSLVPLEKGKEGKRKREVEKIRAITRGLEDKMAVRIGFDGVKPQFFEPVPGVYVGSTPGGFTQVNAPVNRLLVERTLEVVKEFAAESFLDLYCGSGNFSIPLARSGLAGVGVELNPEAIAAAKRAATEQGLDVQFHSQSSVEYVQEACKAGREFGIVLVDPPRAGAKEILPDLVRLAPSTILMVSCDPVTLARDLKSLSQKGYRLCWVEGFDMFPQTHHVESLALLRRE